VILASTGYELRAYLYAIYTPYKSLNRLTCTYRKYSSAYTMEDDFSVEKPRIARLTGPNYRPWSVQVRRLLIGQSLWNVVSLGVQSTVEPGSIGAQEAQSSGEGSDSKATEPSKDRTEVKDAKASTIIMSLCAQGAL